MNIVQYLNKTKRKSKPTENRFAFFSVSNYSSSIESRLNKKLMHQIAHRPTRVYIILDNTASWPPKIQATISNLKIPIEPQFIPPIMVSIRAILSITFKKITPFTLVLAIGSDFIHYYTDVTRISKLPLSLYSP